MVNYILKKLREDQVQMADYALKSAGGYGSEQPGPVRSQCFPGPPWWEHVYRLVVCRQRGRDGEGGRRSAAPRGGRASREDAEGGLRAPSRLGRAAGGAGGPRGRQGGRGEVPAAGSVTLPIPRTKMSDK